ncbi:hypothetical protein ACU8KH_02592 [Lachancea thermotolerans]
MENPSAASGSQLKDGKRRRDRNMRKPKNSPKSGQVNEKSSKKDSQQDTKNGDVKKRSSQKRSRPERKITEDSKHSDTPLVNVPKTTRLSKQCKEQIQQFQHIIGKENFKVFKKSKNSTSYGLSPAFEARAPVGLANSRNAH